MNKSMKSVICRIPDFSFANLATQDLTLHDLYSLFFVKS